ncbi:acetyl-CoA carboxylase biotin carboxyl carrier protein subunit [bacterium]|nr:acetyl-CoA carboxylase biotin carboxyl carrier protein subunit [bacterium]
MSVTPIKIQVGETSALAFRTDTHMWLHINGQTRSFEIQTKRTRQQQQQGEDQLRIQAPMPGKIIKVMCGAGDRVSPGQTLIVMEAMKMEYALKSSIEGVVVQRPGVAGMQVTLGQLLVQLKKV